MLTEFEAFLKSKGNRKWHLVDWGRDGKVGYYWHFDFASGHWSVGASLGLYDDQWYDADIWRAWLSGDDAPFERTPLDTQVDFFKAAYEKMEAKVRKDGPVETAANLERVLINRRFRPPAVARDFIVDCIRKGAMVFGRDGPRSMDYGKVEFGFQGRLMFRVEFGRDANVEAWPMPPPKLWKGQEGYATPIWAAWLGAAPVVQNEAWDSVPFFRTHLDAMIAKCTGDDREKSIAELNALRDAQREKIRLQWQQPKKAH